ncbi:MAG: hypothetical protein VZS44_02180 [Bacilli bacterium]|nr:hypothetical protein [Bacilli bacterium]
MNYKRFETDANDCINVQTFSLTNGSEEILISQLVTDGSIDDENAIVDKRKIDDIDFGYLDADVIEKINQYQNDSTFGIVREVKVKNPSYCMFTLYRYNGKEWVLLGRTIISNKKNKLLYDFRIVKNIPYLGSEYISHSKPKELLPNQKILKRQKFSIRR